MFSSNDLTLEAAKKFDSEDKLKALEKNLIFQKMKMEKSFCIYRS